MILDVACEELLLCLSRGPTVHWTQSLKPRGAARAGPTDRGFPVEVRGSQPRRCMCPLQTAMLEADTRQNPELWASPAAGGRQKRAPVKQDSDKNAPEC